MGFCGHFVTAFIAISNRSKQFGWRKTLDINQLTIKIIKDNYCG